jgi:hypothetical protein
MKLMSVISRWCPLPNSTWLSIWTAFLWVAISIAPAAAEPIYTCNVAATGGLNSCPVPAQWTLTLDPAKVTADARVLHAAQPCNVGKQDMARCAPTWTVLSTIPDGDLIGVCFNSTSASTVGTCAVSNGGGEGYQVKSVALGGAVPLPAPTPAPTPTPTPAPVPASGLTAALIDAGIKLNFDKLTVVPWEAGKTYPDGAAVIYGKAYARIVSVGCKTIDPAILRSVSFTVKPDSSGSRALYDIVKYKACLASGSTDATCAGSTATWHKIGTVANGATCDAPVIRATSTSEYHSVKNADGLVGAAWCVKTVQTMPFKTTNGIMGGATYAAQWPPTEPTADDQVICDALAK